jgi:hypothetical protein
LTLWPSFRLSDTDTVQPDAVLDLAEQTVVFEAKLHSGKSQAGESDSTPTDQLARQWLAVRRARSDQHAVSLVFITRTPSHHAKKCSSHSRR